MEIKRGHSNKVIGQMNFVFWIAVFAIAGILYHF